MQRHPAPFSVSLFILTLTLLTTAATPGYGQNASEAELAAIREQQTKLDKAIGRLDAAAIDPRLMADVQIFSKAGDWIVRHGEFFQKKYAADTVTVLEQGKQRAAELAEGKSSWTTKIGATARAYVSRVDGSLQPYALTLPLNYTPGEEKTWPLYVKLHGRNGRLTEMSFIKSHNNKPPEAEQDWIQLDVYGRTNNAYRWSGEADVFEAIADVKARYNIDDRRVTLWGFSMGGAGAWHLGVHHPSLWSSVGAGAGFVDFYKYQNQSKQLPPYQHYPLRIYDAADYALNANNVPVITYGGEKDKQLLASTTMVANAKQYDVEIAQLIGPGMGHKFDPQSLERFMAFHREHSQQGRPEPPGHREIRFMTYTLKYNRCDWATIEEAPLVYEPSIITSEAISDDALKVTTSNVTAMSVDPRVGRELLIDTDLISISEAEQQAAAPLYIVRREGAWKKLSGEQAEEFQDNPQLHKRHNLQGPIDDAFMEPFICVRGTGKPWSQAQHDWATWTLDRFAAEFDKWLRGRVLIVNDTEVTEEMIAEKNLILFGDPGSNSVLARTLDQLPVKWDRKKLQVAGKDYDPNLHGLSLVYPNPLNRRRYLVVNSGHTFHERDFKASNAWLFPRLGDIAVQSFTKDESGTKYTENTIYADLFDASWQLPSGLK